MWKGRRPGFRKMPELVLFQHMKWHEWRLGGQVSPSSPLPSSPPLAPHPKGLLCVWDFSRDTKKRWGMEGKRRQLFNRFVYALKEKKRTKRTDAICFPLFCPHYPVWIWFGWCKCMCMKEGGSHGESFVHLLLPDSFKKIKASYDPTLSAEKDSRLRCSSPALQFRQILRCSQISQDSVIWFFLSLLQKSH